MSDKLKLSVVHKFQLSTKITMFNSIGIPKGGKFLSFRIQYGVPTMWFEVDPDELTFVVREFIIYTTGTVFAARNAQYLGTVETRDLIDQSFIWHLYERIQP